MQEFHSVLKCQYCETYPEIIYIIHDGLPSIDGVQCRKKGCVREGKAFKLYSWQEEQREMGRTFRCETCDTELTIFVKEDRGSCVIDSVMCNNCDCNDYHIMKQIWDYLHEKRNQEAR